MSDSTVLIPVAERAIDFYGDGLVAFLIIIDGDSEIYVPIRPICQYLGLAWSGQFERIQRDEVLSESIKTIRVTRTNLQGGDPEMLCLPLKFLPGWLFGISASRVKPAIKEKILRYRRECYDVLWEAFKHDILPTADLAPLPTAAPSGAALAYEIATAVQHLARQQMELEQRLGGRLDEAARWVKSLDVRVTALEQRDTHEQAQKISEAQAAELALAVKNVGYALEQHGTVPGYPRVYAELYRRFTISSYHNLPRRKFEEAMDWLHKWYTELNEAAEPER